MENTEVEKSTERRAVGDPYRRYRCALLTPQRVREFSRLHPARAVFDTLLCWLIIGGCWVAVAYHPAWWTVLLAIPIIGCRYYALTIIGHDGFHRRTFPSARWNDLFCDVFIFCPIGAVTRINNRNHLNHHHYLGQKEDPDRHKYGSYNKRRWPQLLGYLLGVRSIFRSVGNVFLRPFKAPETSEQQPIAELPRYSLRDLGLILLWQAALIGGLTWMIGWWAFVLLWMLPVYSFAFLGDNLRSFCEHSQPAHDPESDDHRLITYLSNPLERMFIAPMNMNYHAAHHLWPSIPYYHLPVADRDIRHSPDARGLEWRTSYLRYLWRYLRALPLETGVKRDAAPTAPLSRAA